MSLLPPQTKNPSGFRQTGFVCPARYPRAGANLALAEFFKRPQAEAQIGATTLYHVRGTGAAAAEQLPRRATWVRSRLSCDAALTQERARFLRALAVAVGLAARLVAVRGELRQVFRR